MKYIITKEVEARNIREALEKEKKAEVKRIDVLPEPEERTVGYV